jgi:putative nucleotidyltransferase with HDIG domain
MSTQSNPTAGKGTPVVSEGKPWALKSLPPFPAVALQLLGLLDDDEVPMKKVVDLLKIDPALSAEILRVSNSALYGLSRRIDNVSHAIVVLGTEVVKRLALTVALGRFSQSFIHNQGLRTCWDHSVATALVAEQLAIAMGQPRDRAYTGGLLHDVGRLALLACYPVEYGNLFEVAHENDFNELECERQLFDIDHCGAGEWLAHTWNLPTDFVEAIAHHHTAEPNDTSLLSIVTAANAIADAIGFNVVRMPPKSDVSGIIAKLPMDDRDGMIAKLEAFPAEIKTTIGAVTPASGLRR